MTPPTPSDEFEPPKHSVSARIVEILERVCATGVRISIPILLITMSCFFGYLFVGSVLVYLGLWSPSYPFLSLTGDIYCAWLGFLAGGAFCLGTGSFIVLLIINEEDSIYNAIALLASFVAFGCGAGVMRLTFETVLATLF